MEMFTFQPKNQFLFQILNDYCSLTLMTKEKILHSTHGTKIISVLYNGGASYHSNKLQKCKIFFSFVLFYVVDK